jgi:hypothetical protein
MAKIHILHSLINMWAADIWFLGKRTVDVSGTATTHNLYHTFL